MILTNERLLEVRGLKTYYFTSGGVVKAVDGVNFHVNKGETLGLVGESGCGKSTVALSVMKLVPSPPGRIVDGKIMFKGEDLLEKSDSEMRKIRGNEIAMCFQDPRTFLNPVMNIGNQIAETIRQHQSVSISGLRKKVIEILDMVGIPSPSEIIRSYPHQLSGGMRQRVIIAIALSCRPALVIADEPTTAVDVIIQDHILGLLRSLKEKLGISILLITHDFGIIAELSDRVGVMYAGDMVEVAGARAILRSPTHPYAEALLNSLPSRYLTTGEKRLRNIKGFVPDLTDPPSGCKFHPRCSYATELCSREKPENVQLESEHFVACHHPLL